MTRLILIRHGETDWNRQGKCLGKTDIPLNNTGKKQAMAVAGQLKKEKIAAIYSSTLQRSIQSAAEIASRHGLKVRQLAGFDEVDFGEWEGLTFNGIESMHREQAEEYLKKPAGFDFPGGEGMGKLNARAIASLEKVLEKHRGETVLVAGHGGSNRAIIANALGICLENQWRIKQDLACINTIDFLEGTPIVSLVNSQNYRADGK